MMRTVETILVIGLLATVLSVSLFATWPSLRRASSLDLRRIAFTTLETLDANSSLSQTAFKPSNDSAWNNLQSALSSCLPANTVYNLTVYQILNSSGSTALYTPISSIANTQSLGESTDVASYLVTYNATYSVTALKIGGASGGTLYLLNCSDASGWWITGYTPQGLVQDLLNLLSPYFQQTVVVQDTTQLAKILNGTKLQNETLQNAVVCNAFGEAVPIPQGYYMSANVGYDPVNNSYARYCYTLGQRVRSYNWTWVSMVGWPFYYVSNKAALATSQNTYGIYGMSKNVGYGCTAFLQGLDNQNYLYSLGVNFTSQNLTSLTSQALYYCNYYGLYPNSWQNPSRSINLTQVLNNYHLSMAFQMFDYQLDNTTVGGALFSNSVSGSFLDLGLTRTPDVRLTALGLLGYYKPTLYPSAQATSESSRLVVLTLGLMGGG
jgi:hypothetical protein